MQQRRDQPGGQQGQQGQPGQQGQQDQQGQQGGGWRSQQGGFQSAPHVQQGGPRRQDRQQSQQGAQAYGAEQYQSMAEVALRGTALLWDLQMETARNLLRTQARTAALLGVPDYSELFCLGDDRARRIFTAGAEQMLHSARQARETVLEVQRQIGRLAEQRTIGIAEEVRDQIEQISRHTEVGLQEIRGIAATEADRAEELADYAMNGESQDAQHGQSTFEGMESRGQEGAQPQGNGEASAEGERAHAEGEANPRNDSPATRETRERGRRR
jgi:hypothetical protein